MDTAPHDELSANEDFREHERTYQGFLAVTKWGIIILVVLVIMLYIVIRP